LNRAEVPKAAKEALCALDKLRKTAERKNVELSDLLFEEFNEYMTGQKQRLKDADMTSFDPAMRRRASRNSTSSCSSSSSRAHRHNTRARSNSLGSQGVPMTSELLDLDACNDVFSPKSEDSRLNSDTEPDFSYTPPGHLIDSEDEFASFSGFSAEDLHLLESSTHYCDPASLALNFPDGNYYNVDSLGADVNIALSLADPLSVQPIPPFLQHISNYSGLPPMGMVGGPTPSTHQLASFASLPLPMYTSHLAGFDGFTTYLPYDATLSFPDSLKLTHSFGAYSR
jgi:hypothetical protein